MSRKVWPKTTSSMKPQFFSWSGLYGQTIFLGIAVVISYYFSQLRFGVVGIIPEASLGKLVAGVAQLPIQYRALVPWVVNFILYIADLVPLKQHIGPEIVFQFIELISTVILVLLFRSYVSLFVSNLTTARLLSLSVFFPLLFHYVLWIPAYPSLQYLQWFAWDIPSIAFITAGLVLLYKKEWMLYYLVFSVATFNRETSCFLTFVYLFVELGRAKPKDLVLHCAFQAVIWFAVKYVLFRIYIGNEVEGGSEYFSRGLFYAAEFYDGRNLATVTNIRMYPFLLGVIGYVWIPVLLGVGLIRDHFVKRSLLVFIPFYVGMFYVGAMTEMRNFGELIPIVMMAFLLILIQLLNAESNWSLQALETGPDLIDAESPKEVTVL